MPADWLVAWRASNREIAIQRAHGKCQFCAGHHWQELACHHAFGRGNMVSEPLASHYVFLAMLDLKHHGLIHHRDGEVCRRQIRLAAIAKFHEAFPLVTPELAEEDDDDPVWIARRLEVAMRADGSWMTLEIEAKAA